MLFKGCRVGHEAVVRVEIEDKTFELDPRFDVHIYDHTGFDYGKTNKGATQLALALLYEATGGDEPFVVDTVDVFMNDVVSRLEENWTLTEDQILEAVGYF